MKRFLAVQAVGLAGTYLSWGATGVAVYIGTVSVWMLGVFCGYVGALHMPQPERLDAEQAQSIATAAARMALLQQDRRYS